ncbi:GNAT family N-acetyltransferase [Reyranella sp. CPCC 100927]|nr:GNAT family N-acetyltransferase [Reyranella sp. CPCC 100927]
MTISSMPRRQLTTSRLVLRPTSAADADRAFDIQSDWAVTRMLSMASFPPDRDEIGRWFADHRREWAAGEAFRFAVERGGRFIGLVDVDEVRGGDGELGYWYEQPVWGQGYAFEAAKAIVRFAFDEVGLSRLRSGHAADNAASGKVLLKLGFQPLDTVQRRSRSRGEDIMQCRYVLANPARS